MTENTERSVSQTAQGVTAQANPLSSIKLELVISIAVLVVVFVLSELLIADRPTQFVVLLSSALLCAGWLVFRISQVVKYVTQRTDTMKIHGKK